jgi:mannose-6-phosphate isomerase-like protein (cupin superfamily)
MHQVVRAADAKPEEPPGYQGHAAGFRRAELVGQASGAAHTGLWHCELDERGWLATHVHSYEEAFYVLEGTAAIRVGERAYQLGAGDYGVVPVGVPHAWSNPGSAPARWLAMLSPRPRAHPRDTFFTDGAPPAGPASTPDFRDPRVRWLGHFEHQQLPPPGELQMDGYRGGNVTGISLQMLVDRLLGAQHLTLFMVQFQAGGEGNVHDHPFEECYFFLSGEAEAVLDGQWYTIRAGDTVWTGVGGTHGFFNRGSAPMRWIETQAPQPPAQGAFRFAADWEHLERLTGPSALASHEGGRR